MSSDTFIATEDEVEEDSSPVEFVSSASSSVVIFAPVVLFLFEGVRLSGRLEKKSGPVVTNLTGLVRARERAFFDSASAVLADAKASFKSLSSFANWTNLQMNSMI